MYVENKNFDTPRKRMAFIFKQLITAKDCLITEELAFLMNVGRSTIINDLKNLNEELQLYHLSIEGKASFGIKLVGKEFYIRYFILENMYSFFFLDEEDEYIISSIMDYFVKKISLEYMTQVAFQKNILLMLNRVKAGYHLDKLADKYYILEEHVMFPVINIIADQLETALGINLSKEERIFIAIPIVAMRTPTNIEAIEDFVITVDIKNLMKKICEQIKIDLNLTVSYENIKDEFFYYIRNSL